MNGLTVLVLLTAGATAGWFLAQVFYREDLEAMRRYYKRHRVDEDLRRRIDKWDNR